MKDNKLPIFEIISLLIGEILTSLIICAVYLIIKKFDYTVALGTLLGSAVTVFNFLLLSISAARAVDKIMAEVKDVEMTEEQAAQFANENRLRVQNAMRLSFIIRSVLMAAAFVVAFKLPYFEVISTLIPLVMFRPILFVAGLIKKKGAQQ